MVVDKKLFNESEWSDKIARCNAFDLSIKYLKRRQPVRIIVQISKTNHAVNPKDFNHIEPFDSYR